MGFLAQRHVMSILRSGRRNPWVDKPLDPTQLEDSADKSATTAERVETRDFLRTLSRRLESSLSRQGFEMFHRLYVQQESVDVVRETCGLSEDAIYAWRSRLRRLVRTLARDLEGEAVLLSGSRQSPRMTLEDDPS